MTDYRDPLRPRPRPHERNPEPESGFSLATWAWIAGIALCTIIVVLIASGTIGNSQ